jgi:hypothetical protein
MYTVFGCILYLDVTEWDVTRLFDRVKNRRPRIDADPAEDADLGKYFVNPRLGHLDEPCIVKDLHGRILVWHLPDIYAQHRIVSFPFTIFSLTK